MTRGSVQFLATGPDPVFRTIQGEGIRLGRLSTFVRFYGCNQSCSWCDTKQSWKPGPNGGTPVIYEWDDETPLNGRFLWESDPTPLGDKEVKVPPMEGFSYDGWHDPTDLVITGGNPMLPQHREALSAIVYRWPGDITIETNAYGSDTLPDRALFTRLVTHRRQRSTLWSLSPKLAEWDSNVISSFITRALDVPDQEVQLKVVISSVEQAEALLQARLTGLRLSGSYLRSVSVILQPEWSVTRTLVPELLSSKSPLLRDFRGFKDVRVIPQVHKSLRIL